MDPLVIGRDPGCDIPIADTSVSRSHAEVVELGDGRFQLRDLRSTNGTYYDLNGRFARVEDSVLVDAGTKVSIGDYETTIADLLGIPAGAAVPAGGVVQEAPPQTPAEAPPRPLPVAKFGEENPPEDFAEPPPDVFPTPVPGAAPAARPRPVPAPGRPKWLLYGGIAAAVLLLLGGAGAWFMLQSPRDAFMYGCVDRESKGGTKAQAQKTCTCAADILEARLTPDEFKQLNAELSPIRNRSDFETQIAGKLITGGVVNAKVSATLIQVAAVCAFQ